MACSRERREHRLARSSSSHTSASSRVRRRLQLLLLHSRILAYTVGLPLHLPQVNTPSSRSDSSERRSSRNLHSIFAGGAVPPFDPAAAIMHDMTTLCSAMERYSHSHCYSH
jgi:hypothetical protein